MTASTGPLSFAHAQGLAEANCPFRSLRGPNGEQAYRTASNGRSIWLRPLGQAVAVGVERPLGGEVAAAALPDQALFSQPGLHAYQPRTVAEFEQILREVFAATALRLSTAADTGAAATATPPIGSHALPAMIATNTIFYGPPGTGKTYRTSRHAVSLCDGQQARDLDDEGIRKRFEQLRHEGRIFFVTFHQSFGYEEFVEGLRPRTTEAGQVVYDIRPGIFKLACDAARTPALRRPGLGNRPIRERKLFKMSLGATWNEEGATVFDYCVRNDCVLLGWGNDIDFSDCGTKTEIEARIAHQVRLPEKPGSHARMVNRFKHEMKPGDLILVSQGNHYVRGIAEVTGDYAFAEDAPFQQMRPVRWLAVFPGGRPVADFYDRTLSMLALYRLDGDGLRYDSLEQALAPDDVAGPAKPHVLIIDEINRANISKVFGELITLLEPDKREGMPQALRVMLPYSGTEFGIPANLHVIGTMNTADRSIALLDTALRRRFDFDEIMPDPRCLQGRVIDGVDLEQLLTALNERIESLFDRDHTIGHAYFMEVRTPEDLQRVFRRRVIPLLQEYFHDNWARIRIALNDRDGHFIERIQRRLPALVTDDESVDDELAVSYRVNPVDFPIEAIRRVYSGV